MRQDGSKSGQNRIIIPNFVIWQKKVCQLIYKQCQAMSGFDVVPIAWTQYESDSCRVFLPCNLCGRPFFRWYICFLIGMAPAKAAPGLYSGVFAMYILHHGSRKDDDSNLKAKNIIFYAPCVLYVLSTTTIALDLATSLVQVDPVGDHFAALR